MKHVTLADLFYQLLVLATVVIGLVRWKQLKKADRWICVLIVLTLIQEVVAVTVRELHGKDLFTYHIYSPIELLVVCLYFNQSITYFRKHNIGLWIGIGGVVVGVLNSVFLQPPTTTLNSYFLLFEGAVIIILCLLSFYQILMREDSQPLPQAGFWLTVCFLFYWSTTFAGFGLYNIPPSFEADFVKRIMDEFRHISNYVFYMAVFLVFYFYPKLTPSGD